MLKERIEQAALHGLQRVGKDPIGRLALSIAQLRYGAGLKHEGREHFRTITIPKLLRGESLVGSEEAVVLSGYDREIRGTENLEGLDWPFIAVGNHYNLGPLEAWHVPLTSSAIKESTGQEIRWVMGEGKEKFHQPWESIRKAVSFITSAAHERIALSSGNIFEGNGTVTDAISTIIKQKRPLAFCLERKPTIGLEQGDREIGFVISMLARRYKLPIVVVGAWQDANEKLSIQFGRKIEPDEIVTAAENANNDNLDKEQRRALEGQRVADYIMERLAVVMPQNLRGHYSYIKQEVG